MSEIRTSSVEVLDTLTPEAVALFLSKVPEARIAGEITADGIVPDNEAARYLRAIGIHPRNIFPAEIEDHHDPRDFAITMLLNPIINRYKESDSYTNHPEITHYVFGEIIQKVPERGDYGNGDIADDAWHLDNTPDLPCAVGMAATLASTQFAIGDFEYLGEQPSYGIDGLEILIPEPNTMAYSNQLSTLLHRAPTVPPNRARKFLRVFIGPKPDEYEKVYTSDNAQN